MLIGKIDTTPWKHKVFHCQDSVVRPEHLFSGKGRIFKDRYQVLDTIKSGGMGCVFKARDLQLGLTVAIKRMFLPSRGSEDMRYARKLLNQEADILYRLNHRGIPRFIDFFTEHDRVSERYAHYLVMSYIEGTDLETVIQERGGKPFPVDEAIRFMSRVLSILSYLHTRKPPIIYRDLKPSNIMVRDDTGDIVLIDFGIAQEYSPGTRGLIVGTPGYAPPEQYGGHSTERSDLYSLGAVMHYLLTGIDPEDSSRRPFYFEPVRFINREVPGYLESILLSLLESDTEKRPHSARKVLQMLEKKSKAVPTPYRGAPEGCQSKKRCFLGSTPLHFAAMRGDEEATHRSIQSGIPADTRDILGLTPLHYAAGKGHPGVVKLLLNEKIDVDVPDRRQRTALFHAVESGCIDIVRDLLDHGAGTDTRDRNRSTPLHQAARKGQADIIRLLVDYGSEINARDNRDDTPLHSAVRERRKTGVETLLQAGADPNAKNYVGWTPLTIAWYYFAGSDIVQILLANGAEGKTLWDLVVELY